MRDDANRWAAVAIAAGTAAINAGCASAWLAQSRQTTRNRFRRIASSGAVPHFAGTRTSIETRQFLALNGDGPSVPAAH